MSSSAVVHSVDLASLPILESKPWREALLGALHAGGRVVTVFGRAERDAVTITSVLEAADHSIQVLRAAVSKEQGYHELTSEYPALHCFERELHEQTGVRIVAHPWLKPIRFQGQEQAAMNAYPFYKIEGKEVHEVAVGPIHAGVIEPGSFRFMCLGERVHHLEVHHGYQHRGAEGQLLKGDPRGLAPLVETISGDTSVAHAWAYCAALEKLAGVELDTQADVARAVALELERVAMHLSGVSGMAGDVGFLQGATTYGRLRTTAINTTMRLCGSRFGRGALRPGGVGLRLPADILPLIRSNLRLLQTDLAIVNKLFLNAHTVQHRLCRVGVLSRARALEVGMVGQAARASGVDVDVRQRATTGAYGELPIAAVGFTDGDCWARTRQRLAELDASLAWIVAALERYPTLGGARLPIGALQPKTLSVAVVEGWRGEVVHCLETGERGELVHYKVQDPSLRNWLGLALAVRENEISDFPICNKSFDLSYCGNDL